MDYEKILEEWTEEVYMLMDKIQEKQRNEEFGTRAYYACGGLIDGLAHSLALFNLVEKRKREGIK